MLVVLSDTHAREEPDLTPAIREALTTSDGLIHAGDFVREPVLDAFEAMVPTVYAVYGNVDDDGIRDRLQRARLLDHLGFTILVVHTVRGGQTGLATFGRQNNADLVISGHTHTPGYTWTGEIGLLNPGSHSQPRGNRPAFATLSVEDNRLQGTLCDPDGTPFERFEVQGEHC